MARSATEGLSLTAASTTGQLGGFRRSLGGHGAERLPHVHHRQTNALALLRTEPIVERGHARLGAIGTPKPDRPAAQQVAHDDAIGVTFADRNLVDANHLRRGRASARDLSGHVLLFKLFDRMPIKLELLSHVLDRCLAAAPTNEVGEPLSKMRVVGQELEQLAFHFATRPAEDASHIEFKIDPRVSAGEIAHATDRAIIPTVMLCPAVATQRFFERRVSLMMRALKSPKRPRTVATGRKPGKAYASCSRRLRVRVAIRKPRQISSTTHTLKTLL